MTCANRDGCQRTDIIARGLCKACYQRIQRQGNLGLYQPAGRKKYPGAILTDVAETWGTTPYHILAGINREARAATVHTLLDAGHNGTVAARTVGVDRSYPRRIVKQPAPTPPDNVEPPPSDGTCDVPGCDRQADRMRICVGHYQRWSRDGRIEPDRPLRPINMPGPVLDVDVHDSTTYRNGCRCDTCRQAATRRVKLGRLRPVRVDNAEAVEHIAKLHAAGLSTARIAKLAGVSHNALYSWIRDGRTRALQETVDKVLAVETPCVDCGAPPFAGGLRCWPCFQTVATPKRASGCGTTGGYARHRREGTEPCVSCREANALQSRLKRSA